MPRVTDPSQASMAMRAFSSEAPVFWLRMPAASRGRDVAERHHLAAREDGGQHAFPRAPQKDEHHVGRRFLQRLEERVGRGRAQQVHPVQDVDLLVGLDGRVATVSVTMSRICSTR